MMVKLEDLRRWLKVEDSFDDALLTDLVAVTEAFFLSELRWDAADLVDAPADLKQAAMEYAGLRYRARDWGDRASASLGGDTVTMGSPAAGTWAFVLGTIEKYRLVQV